MTNAADDFKIVFEKLAEDVAGMEATEVDKAGVSAAELDEIDELRRFAAELMQPQPILFTTT